MSESESDCFRSQRASAGAFFARASVDSSSSVSLFKDQPESQDHSQITDSSSSESLSESESESESESDCFRSERERGRPSLGRPRER